MSLYFDVTQEDLVSSIDVAGKVIACIINYTPMAILILLVLTILALPEKANWKLRVVVAYITASEATNLFTSHVMWAQCKKEEAAYFPETPHCNEFRLSASNTLMYKVAASLLYALAVYLYIGGKPGPVTLARPKGVSVKTSSIVDSVHKHLCIRDSIAHMRRLRRNFAETQSVKRHLHHVVFQSRVLHHYHTERELSQKDRYFFFPFQRLCSSIGLMVLMLMLVLMLLFPQETMKMAPTHLAKRPLMKMPPTVMMTLQPTPKTTLQLIPLAPDMPLPEMTHLLVPEMKVPPKKTTFFLRKGLPLRKTLLQNGPLSMTLRIKPVRKALQTLTRTLTGLKFLFQENLLKPLLQGNNLPPEGTNK